MTGLRAKMRYVGNAFTVIGYIYKWVNIYHKDGWHLRKYKGYNKWTNGYNQNCPVCVYSKEFSK